MYRDENKKVYRVLGFAAVSSARQADEEKESLPVQLEMNRAHTEKHGAHLIGQLVVPGKSRSIILFEEAATTVVGYWQPTDGEREEVYVYAKLLELIKANAFDVLMFFNRSRLGRKASLSMTIVSLCDQANIGLYETSSPPPSLGMNSGYTEALIGAFKSVSAEDEIRKIQYHQNIGMIGRVEAGNFAKGVPWPWVAKYKENGEMYAELDPTSKAALLMLIDLYLNQGLGYPTISIELNAAGFRSPNGLDWTFNKVSSVLLNIKRYAGFVEFNKETNNPERKYIISRSKWEAPIDEETAERVIAERHLRWFAKGRVQRDHRFSQLVYCEICGTTMRASTMKKTRMCADGREANYIYNTYKCKTGAHPLYNVMEWKIVEALDIHITYISGFENMNDLLPQMQDRTAQLYDEVGEINGQIIDAQKQLEQADDAYMSKLMDMTRYQRQVKKINERIASLETRRVQLDIVIAKEKRTGNRVKRLEEIKESGMYYLHEEPNDTIAATWLRANYRVWVRDGNVTTVETL